MTHGAGPRGVVSLPRFVAAMTKESQRPWRPTPSLGAGHPVTATILVPSHSPKCIGKEPVEQVGHTHGAARKASLGLDGDHVTRPIGVSSEGVGYAGGGGGTTGRATELRTGVSRAPRQRRATTGAKAADPGIGYFRPMQFA